MNNDYVDFKFGDHWASEFNLLAVSNGDRHNPPVYGNVNPNTATIMGKKGVYKWKTQVNEKIFNISIAFDSVTIAQLNQIKQWLEPHKIQKLIFVDEPYKYYWAALNSEIDFSFLPFIEGEKKVGERTIIEGVYKGEMTIPFICIDNDGYSEEGTFEGLENEPELATIKGSNFVITDADNDYIEDLKIEGKSEQEVKYNNDLSDTDFVNVNSRSVEKEWKTNNLAQIQAENGEVTINAPYEYSGIAQEQRESIIDHKYYASAEVKTDNINTALEIAGKNITNSVQGKDINITDGLVGNVDDLVVGGDASQDKKYNNEINSSFLEDLDNWESVQNATISREKQTAIVTANSKFDGIAQETEESNIGDKYYLSAKVKSNSSDTVLEVETEKGTAEGEQITINDAASRKLEDFKLYGNSNQEKYDEKLLGTGESITVENNTYKRYTKVNVSGNTVQEIKEKIEGNTVNGENIDLNDVDDSKEHEIKIMGNSKQEIRSGKNLAYVENINQVGVKIAKLNGYIGNITIALKTKEGTSQVNYRLIYEDGTQSNNYIIAKNQSNEIWYVANINIEKALSTIELYNVTTEGFIVRSLIHVMVLKGQYKNITDNDYEPYGAMPSPEYPSEIESCGDNINKFDKNDSIQQDYIFDANGNLSANVGGYFIQTIYIKVKTNTTYTISATNIDYFRICEYANDKTFIQRILGSGTQKYYTFTTSSTTEYIRVSCNKNNLNSIKLEEGSKLTPYTPYNCGSADFKVENKNYLDDSKRGWAVNNIYFGTGDTTSTFLLKEGTYTFSVDVVCKLDILTSSNLFSKSDTKSLTFTLTEDTQIKARAQSTSFTNINSIGYAQIEKRETATDYIPHKEQIYTILTQQPMRSIGDIRDTFVKVNNKWYERHYIVKTTLGGTESWSSWNISGQTKTKAYVIRNFYGAIGETNINAGCPYLSDYFLFNENNDYNNDEELLFINENNALGIKIKTENGSDLTTFKNWLSNHNIPVYFISKNPTDIECTPEQNEILDKIEQEAHMYKNVTHIYSTDEIAPVLEVKYNSQKESPSPESPSDIKNCEGNINVKLTNGSQSKIISFPLVSGQKLHEGDYLAKDGIHQIRKTRILDGTENYTALVDDGFADYVYFIEINDSKMEYQSSICSHFKNVNISWVKDVGQQGEYSDHTQVPRKYFVSDKPTVTEFKSWLAEQYANGTPVTLEYELAEEMILPYTESQQAAYNQLMYLTMYQGYNLLTSDDEIKPQFEWIIPESPSPDYPSEVESCGDNVNLLDISQNNHIESILNEGKIEFTENGYIRKFDNGIGQNGDFFYVPVKKGKTYTVSYSTNALFTNIRLYKKDKTTKFQELNIGTDKTTISTTFIAEEDGIYFRTWLTANSDLRSAELYWAKIEEGTTATPYSPYGQGCITETICDKNIFNPDLAVNNTYQNINNSWIVSTLNFAWTSGLQSIKENTQYSSNYLLVTGAFYDKEKNVIKKNAIYEKTTFTTPQGACYVDFTIYKETLKYENAKQIQIVEGTELGDYEEHKSQTYKIPTQQPFRSIGDIRDTFVKINNKWYERHNVSRYEITGNEDTWQQGGHSGWINYNNVFGFLISDGEKTTAGEDGLNIKSNQYLSAHINTVTHYGSSYLISNHYTYGKNVWFLNKDFDNLDDWKAYLQELYNAGTPVYVDYILATPLDIECTEEQSAILNSIKIYREITHIYSTDNIIPSMQLEYIKQPQQQAKLSTTNTQETLSMIYQTNIDNTRVLVSNIGSNASLIEVTNPVLVNLTKQFGSGNEPTKKWCDQNLTFFNCAEGGAPSVETSSRVKTVGSNINLFDPNNHIELVGQHRSFINGVIGDNANFLGLKIPVLGNTIYSASSNMTRNMFSNLCYFDENFNFMWGEAFNGGTNTFRTPNKCRYVTLALNRNYSWFKLEYGNTITQPSEYNLANIDTKITGYDNQFKSFPLLAGQELLQLSNGTQDTLEANGIYKRIGKYIVTGQEQFTDNGTYAVIALTNCKENSKVYSNYFENKQNILWGVNSGIAFGYNNEIKNLAELRTFLQAKYNSTNPVIIYYELKTQQIIPYSNAQKEWYDDFAIYRKNTQITTIAETKPYYSFTYDINDTYAVNSTKVNEYEKLGLIFNNLEDRPRFIVNSTADVNSIIKMRNPIVVDLTNEFGVGKEPSLEWCQNNINFNNSCEYGTPSPKVPSELISVGTNPIKIENKNRNLIAEQNLLNWTKQYCTVEKLDEKFDDKSIFRISYENHHAGVLSTKLQISNKDLVFSVWARVVKADNPVLNRLAVAKLTSSSSSSETIGTKAFENKKGEWQKVYIPITQSNIANAAELILRIQHNGFTDDSTVIDICMPQLEEGFTPHDYIAYAPNMVNNLIFVEPLRQLPNGVRDEFSKNGIIRKVGKYTIKSTNSVFGATFNTNKQYITISGSLGIYVRGDGVWTAPSFYCNRFKDCTALYDIANGISSREKEGIGIIDGEYRLCIRADLIGVVSTDTRDDIIRKYKVWLDENPIEIYYEKEIPDLEPLTELQLNTLSNLFTRKFYNNWVVSGTANPEIELTYKLSSSVNDIHPWVTGSNLLDKTWLYSDNNIHTKSYIEVETGDATKSGVSADRPVYLLNSGTTESNLNLKFDYISIVSPLTIMVTKGKITDNGFDEIAPVSEITIKPFLNYQPFIDLYDNIPSNWYIEIDSTLGEVYLKHKTDESKVLNLNRFNDNHTFLTLASCNFVDYNKVFPTIISDIKDTAIENTIFNKLSVAPAPEAYRLKNASIEWKHTYL